MDLDEVELVLRVDAPVSSMTSRNSVSPALRRSVSHSSGVGLAVAVADGGDAVVDEEDSGLAVPEHAEVDQHGVLGRRQRLQALERLAPAPSAESPKRTVSSYIA